MDALGTQRLRPSAPRPAAGAAPARAHPTSTLSAPRSHERHALALVGAALARTTGVRAPEALRSVVRALDAAALEGLIAKADAARPGGRRLGRMPWAKTLAGLEVGEVRALPALALRPGQAQLSFDHAAEKLVELVDALLDDDAFRLADAHDDDDFPAVVGPSGGFALLRDGHHKLAAALALSALVHDVLGTGTVASSRTSPAVGKAWRSLAERVPPPAELEVPVLVTGQEAELDPGRSEPERVSAFLRLFDDPDRYDPPLHLARRGGGRAEAPPERMSDLEDNPFRLLAATLVAKLSWDADGMPKLKSSDAPLWIKGPDSPPYIEFHVAEVLERASAPFGYVPAPGRPVPAEVRQAFRRALLDAQAAGDAALRKVIGFEHEIDGRKLRASMELLPHAVLDFGREGRGIGPGDREIPIVLLPSDAPDVHRLHAAARLHDALVASGADLAAHAITPAVARAAIERLGHVHDDVGLWINARGATTAQLHRDARLARGLGLSLVRAGKSRLEPLGPIGWRPVLWVDVPGLPASQAYVLGELWSDLFARIGHQARRLPEIAEEARRRLVEAKTRPDHPLYGRVGPIPAVVAGGAEAVAASLRVHRKSRALEVGHPVPGALVQPDVLGPRTKLVVPPS